MDCTRRSIYKVRLTKICYLASIKVLTRIWEPENPEEEILNATSKGEIDIVKNLLVSDRNLALVKDCDGYSPLHRACYENHLNIAELLLEYGADPFALTNDHWQPLHSASKWNSTFCVALLLEWGANVNCVTQGGLTPLHLASSNVSAYETLAVLLNHPLIDHTILSSNNENPYEISRRCGPFSPLFETVSHSLNEI